MKTSLRLMGSIFGGDRTPLPTGINLSSSKAPIDKVARRLSISRGKAVLVIFIVAIGPVATARLDWVRRSSWDGVFRPPSGVLLAHFSGHLQRNDDIETLIPEAVSQDVRALIDGGSES